LATDTEKLTEAWISPAGGGNFTNDNGKPYQII